MHEHMHGAGLAAGVPLDLLAFLTLGVLGSAAHCVGMCSPFVFMVSRRYGLPAGTHIPWIAQVWYTAGRMTTYGLLGGLGGALGGALQIAGALVGLQRAATVVAGLVLVVTALASLVSLIPGFSLTPGASGPPAVRVSPLRFTSFGTGAASVVSRMTARLGRHMPGHPYSLGLVLGLLPCGLLYSAVVAAMASGSALTGAAGLAVFALGTAPALFGVSIADALFVRRRATLNRLAHVFVLVMGVWFLYRAVQPMHLH